MLRRNFFSLVIALAILYLSLTDTDKFETANVFEFTDKLVHYLMYFGLTLIILFENRKIYFSVQHIVFTAIISAVYGMLMEVLQLMLTNDRSASSLDALTNLIGAASAAILWYFIRNRIERILR